MPENNKEKELLARISDLEAQIKKLKNRKKYGLVWEEKEEQVVSDCQSKLPILKEIKNKEIKTDKTNPVNILIEGDNYHSLSVLNYTHKGKIDVIYIDPPYNTGARDWRYNNDYVDGEDPYRHTKWISFMYQRLRISKDLLKKDGIICVTIDDYEMPRLWMILEELFGENNHLGTVVIRNNPKGRMTQRKFSLVHEYAIFFGKSSASKIKKLPVDPSEKSHNYRQNKKGDWYLEVNLRKQGVDSNAINKKGQLLDRYYPIYFDPKNRKVSVTKKYEIEILPIDSGNQKRIWRRSKDVIEEMFENNELIIKKNNKNGYQIYFKFRGGLDGRLAQSIWYDAKFSASDHGTRILDKLLNKRELFQYPKSPYAVEESILAATNNKKAIILDYFAGSGTTGHAVLNLNKEDGGNRKFILCTNNENEICENVTYPRIEKVIKGYDDSKNNKVEGLGGNLKYYKTAFVDTEHISKISDEGKIKLSYQVGEMIALRENILDEVEKNDWWQIFADDKKTLAIYFKEDKSKLQKLVAKLNKDDKKVILYIFSWGKNEYKNEFSDYKNIRVEDIPEPILEVYKEINKL